MTDPERVDAKHDKVFAEVTECLPDSRGALCSYSPKG